MTFRDYDSRRYFNLKELLHLRAKTQVHGTDTTRERRIIQRQMAKDRATPLEKHA